MAGCWTDDVCMCQWTGSSLFEVMACLWFGTKPFPESVLTSCHFNWTINTLRPRQNGRHFADDIFKCIFLNENIWISIKISLKFVPKGPINNIPALVQIMAWRHPGNKPWSEAMMVNLPTHICVTRPQWVKGKLQSTFNKKYILFPFKEIHLKICKMLDHFVVAQYANWMDGSWVPWMIWQWFFKIKQEKIR